MFSWPKHCNSVGLREASGCNKPDCKTIDNETQFCWLLSYQPKSSYKKAKLVKAQQLNITVFCYLMKLDRFASIYRQFSTTVVQKRNPTVSRDPSKELHARLIRTHNHADPVAISPVLRSYSRSSYSLLNAQVVFNQIQTPNLLIFNYMITSFSQSQYPAGAIHMYDRLRGCSFNADNIIFVFVFKACGRAADLVRGKRVHVHALKFGFQPDVYVSNAMVHMYGSLGELAFAHKVFDEMSDRDLVSWNSLICAYSQRSRFNEVVSLFKAMKAIVVEPDEVTLMKVILACTQLGDWELADHLVEEHIEKTHIQLNVYLGNTLIDMYGKRGLVKSAQRVFEQMVIRNLVSWNALIMGYAKSGDMVSARNLFNRMPGRDAVSWTSMVTGYSQVGRFQEAVKLFQEMVEEAKVEPDEITVSGVLSACSHLGMLNIGIGVHELIRTHGIKEDIHVGNALIDMYSKCGVADKALDVFLGMKQKDSVSWTSVITGLAVNGFADRAVQLFDQMLKDNVAPTHGSFVGILLACAHAGLVDKGLEYFNIMEKVYGLKPEMKHYGCVVDLLSRSGCLERAYEFISSMPVQPDVVLWRMLLSACNFRGSIVLAETVSNKLLELDHGVNGTYLLVSQTYAGSHRWDVASRFRDLMKEDCVHKPSALSSIEDIGSQYTAQPSLMSKQ